MNRRKAKTRSLRAMAILVIVMFVTGICSGGAYALYNSQLFAETGAVDENGSQITTKTTGIGINDENASLVDLNDESVNFLFVGVDESEALTDVIMIINMDMINKRITVLQIPRDTYVGESESRSSTGKINGIYGHPDTGKTRIQTLASYINNKFSVSIDHYATIDIDGFKSMVDVLGGVTMDVPQDVIYDGKIALYAGEQTLNGQQAEWFIRYRKGYLQGDIGRQDAQVIFLKALLDQMFEVTPKQAASIASQCISMVTTDMTVSDMVGYYNDVLQIGKDNVGFTRVPGEGINDWGPTRQSVWGVDTVELAEILNEYFRPNSEEVPASELGFLDYRDMESTTSYSYSGSGTTSSGDDDNSTNDTYSYNSRTGEYTASVEDVTGRAPTNSGSSSSRSGTTSESTSGALNGNASRSTNPSNTESNGGTLNGR